MKEKELLDGFITAVHRERFELKAKDMELYARLKTGIYYSDKYEEEFPTVGDNVILEYNSMGDSLIVKTKDRISKFSRKDPDNGRGEQTIAANFDYVFIMMSLNFDFNLKRLERYLTATWQSGAVPIVILTKIDIAEDVEEKLDQVSQVAIGVDICPISSVTGEGMEQIDKYLQPDKCIVFLGSSGVGKSTFTNYLLEKTIMKTSDIREEDSKGHHTTTYRQLFVLENGTKIIDTPGMRELGMWIVDEGMEQSFSDVFDLISHCRFHDCTHTSEPDCAIREALENGTLTIKRWNNFLKIQKESKYQEDKEKKSLREKNKKFGKQIAKHQKELKGRKEIW